MAPLVRATQNRKALNVILLICAALVLISFTAAGYALYDRFNQTNDRRHEQAEINQSFRTTLVNVLCFSRDFTIATKPPLASDQLVRVNAYYTGALQRIGASLQDC